MRQRRQSWRSPGPSRLRRGVTIVLACRRPLAVPHQPGRIAGARSSSRDCRIDPRPGRRRDVERDRPGHRRARRVLRLVRGVSPGDRASTGRCWASSGWPSAAAWCCRSRARTGWLRTAATAAFALLSMVVLPMGLRGEVMFRGVAAMVAAAPMRSHPETRPRRPRCWLALLAPDSDRPRSAADRPARAARRGPRTAHLRSLCRDGGLAPSG